MFLADLHIHSKFSDGRLAIPEIVDLYGSRGFGAIAITDHLCEAKTVLGKAASYVNCTLTPGVFPIYQEILRTEAERAWKQYRMVVLPGMELTKNSVISHKSERLLALGVTNFIAADADAVELAKAVKAEGGVAVATASLWNRREELAPVVDAWEAAIRTKLSLEILESGLPKVASSGLHAARHLTSWKTVFMCERDPQAILSAIRNQDLRLFFYDEEKCNDLRGNLDIGGLGVRNGPDRVRNSPLHAPLPASL